MTRRDKILSTTAIAYFVPPIAGPRFSEAALALRADYIREMGNWRGPVLRSGEGSK